MHVLLKYDKKNKYFTWRPLYIYDDLMEFFLDWEIFRQNLYGKSKHMFYIR